MAHGPEMPSAILWYDFALKLWLVNVRELGSRRNTRDWLSDRDA
jgi:hypothetical protein